MRAIVTAYRRHRFAWLFASLLLTLGAGATVDALGSRYNPLQVLLALNLLAAIASGAHDRSMRVPVVLGIGFVVVRVLRASLALPSLLPVADSLWAIAILVAMVTTVRHALGRGDVDAERILAALDTYLLAAVVFSVAYWTLDHVWPGSFRGIEGPIDQFQAIYFSFVTITTMGYGDITPASAATRGLAIVEAISGQMYLTVLVARLVSLYSQQRD
jgi:hypothetical protein